MTQASEPMAPIPSTRTLESLEMLLDYALLEGAEMRLPLFVLLLHMARLELAHSACRNANVLEAEPLPRQPMSGRS